MLTTSTDLVVRPMPSSVSLSTILLYTCGTIIKERQVYRQLEDRLNLLRS